MATNLLVTGSHGGDDPHVESKHDALMHAAMLGRGGYILKTRNWTMKPTAKDANNITIPAWDLVVEGRQIYIAAPTDVNIQSGSQGQKRRDLIVARYALNSGTGVETVTLEAIKGGITITSIDTLVNVMHPLEDVWDSLTQMPDIESGMFIGSTSVNGAVLIKWGRHSTAPFAAFVTYAPNNNDSVTNNFTPLIWSVGDSDFQVRLRDDRSYAWGGAQPVRLYWLATWKR